MNYSNVCDVFGAWAGGRPSSSCNYPTEEPPTMDLPAPPQYETAVTLCHPMEQLPPDEEQPFLFCFYLDQEGNLISDSKRRNCVLLLTLILFLPAAFLVGLAAGGGLGTTTTMTNSWNSIHSMNDTSSNNDTTTSSTTATNMGEEYDEDDVTFESDHDTPASNKFLQTNEYIQSNSNDILLSSYSVKLRQEDKGNLLLLTATDEELLWSSNVGEYPTGNYYTKLQGDGHLVTRTGTPGDSSASNVIWASGNYDAPHDDSASWNYRLVLDEAGTGLQVIRVDSREDENNNFPVSPDMILWSPSPPSSTTTSINTQGEALDSHYNFDYYTSPDSAAPPVDWGAPPEWPGSTMNSLLSGPLVGHTTHSSTRIWAFQGQGVTMELVLTKNNGVIQRLSMPPNAANGASIVEIDSLEPLTVYNYYIRIQTSIVAQGQFQTASYPNEPADFTYLLASCINVRSNKGYPDQPVWDVIRQESSTLDFAILAGDTVYLNDQDWAPGTNEVLFERVWHRNLEQRAEPHFASFIKSIPTYATWDDHEYGTNNSDKNQSGKENSLVAFDNLWANPYRPHHDLKGVFYSFKRANVHFMVMDNRWYRDKTTDTQFGILQKEWLYQELVNSPATFKIIVSGSDVMERDMSVDLDDIGKVVSAHKISGVIFNAGDIHRNEFKVAENDHWPYPVMQITSSGIAREWRRPFCLINVNTFLQDPELTAYFYGADSESVENATWSNDPNLKCSLVPVGDRYQEHHCTETIRLSDLSP